MFRNLQQQTISLTKEREKLSNELFQSREQLENVKQQLERESFDRDLGNLTITSLQKKLTENGIQLSPEELISAQVKEG